MLRALLRRLLGGSRKPMIMGSPAANQLVRTEMLNSGDDGKTERLVRHLAQPKTQQSASQFEVFEFLSSFDLVLSETGFQNGIIAEHRSEVASEAFDIFTSLLFDELDAMGWRYDGWECGIVKG